MRTLISVLVVLALTLGAASAQMSQGGNCSPEGTWYGYNDIGDIWIVTVNRSGLRSFTTVMDGGANLLDIPGVIGRTGFEGELVRTGPNEYAWTTMGYWVGDVSVGLPPYALAFCPFQADFTSCDSWEALGVCDFYGMLAHDVDPFEEGFFLQSGPPTQAFFKRMPMTFPE